MGRRPNPPERDQTFGIMMTLVILFIFMFMQMYMIYEALENVK